jgi:hypothetical protein
MNFFTRLRGRDNALQRIEVRDKHCLFSLMISTLRRVFLAMTVEDLMNDGHSVSLE